jgi:hypothetical protein
MSQHSAPIVPTILFVDTQRHPWKLAPITRHDVTYHTPTTVRTRDTGTLQQHHVYCIVDDAVWERVQATQARLQSALDALAAGLRNLGSYASRLADAGGMKTAPNPLSATVISAPDPDLSDAGSWFTSRLVPQIERVVITEHTPKMLRRPSSYDGSLVTFSQRDHFVCPDDAAWAQIEAQITLAKAAELNWATMLVELGTYQEALADGRYAQRAPAEKAAPPVPNWPQLASPLVYGHHRNATAGGVAHVWQPAPTPRAKQRHETLCHIVMTEAPHVIAPREKGQSGPRLCPECRQAASDLVRKQEVSVSATTTRTGVRPVSSWGETDVDSSLVGRLEFAGYHWEMAKQTPDGRWHHLMSSRNTALLRNDQVLLRRERLEALLTPAGALAVAAPAGALSTGLQSIARDYIAAREKAGRALLEMASYLALARSMAKHGEWYTFLEATQTSEDQADRLLDIDRKASESPEYADAVRRNFLSPTTAALLARPSTPAVVVEQVLKQPAPPTTRQVTQQIQAAKPNPAALRDLKSAPTAPALHPDYQHQAAVEQILRTLDQWDDSARPAQLQEAYGHARQIRDLLTRDRLFTLIDRAVEGKPNISEVAPITPESRDAAGPWFWAAKSVVHPTAHCWNVRPLPSGAYVAACGLEMPIQPTSGAKGFHCSVCETHADRRQIVPIPGTEPPPITVQTSQGPREVTPLQSNGVLALHTPLLGNGWIISHVATGRAVAQFAQSASAERAYAQLITLDWRLTPEGGTGPVLGLAISRIVTQYDDVDHYEQRLTKLRELEAAAQPAERAIAAASVPQRLNPGDHATAVTLVNSIRACLITDQIGNATDHTRTLLALLTQATATAARDADASPLDSIAQGVTRIEVWADMHRYDSTPDECRTTLAELAALRTRLERLSDAPDVHDDEYDELSGAIGSLELEISGWIESAVAS